jgi:NAD kinase
MLAVNILTINIKFKVNHVYRFTRVQNHIIFKLDQVLQGHFQLDRRFLLEMEVRTNGEVIYDAIALNENLTARG